jgi:hypothetical protein
MSWPPERGALLPNAEPAYGLEEKLSGYSLRLGHAARGKKAEGFARVLAITLGDLDYLVQTLLDRVRTTPMSRVCLAGRFGSTARSSCWSADSATADRTANVLTAWEIRREGDDPRLITAHIVSRDR